MRTKNRGIGRITLAVFGTVGILSLGGCADMDMLQEIFQTAAIDVESEEDINPIDNGAGKNGTDAGNVRENKQEVQQTVETQVSDQGFLEEVNYTYAYNCLSGEEQLWYINIAQCLGNMGEDVRLDNQGIEAGLDETSIDRIFQCVLMDHPELFYVEGYTYTKYNRGEQIVSIRFSGTYSMDKEQAILRSNAIKAAAKPILEGGVGLTGDYEKVKYVYDTIITNTEYSLNAEDNQNIYSVFIHHRSVCQGYSKAVQYLLDRMNVECVLVQGTVDTGEGHAWNLVKVNGSYYYVDATWGDASYQPVDGITAEQYVPEINYDYLCVTTEQLLRTHALQNVVAMPSCTDMKDNYYVHENAYFTEYDREQMSALFENASQKGRNEVTVKCANTECFWEILIAMTDNQDVFEYVKNNYDTVRYTHNEKQLSMTFWVTNE